MALTTSDLSIVQDAVFDARAKWYEIGLQLGVPPSSLDSIRIDGDSNGEKLCETLKVWLKTVLKPTWQNILDALRSRAVGELKIAASVEAKYCCTTAETGGQASGQLMSEDTQLQALKEAQRYIQELEQKLQDSQKENQQLAKQVEEQNRREVEAQQEKHWLQNKINTLEKEKKEACEKKEAGEQQIRQLQKLVSDHEKIRKQLEKQVQQFQQKAEEYQRTIDVLKETSEENVTQLKHTIDEQRKQLHKLESRLEEEICHKKQLHEQLQEMRRAAVIPQKPVQDMRWQKESKAPTQMRRGSAASDFNMAYFSSALSTSVYSYNSDTKEWFQLPDAPHARFTLVIVRGMLTMVGGEVGGMPTNSLLSLMMEEKNKKWLPHYPVMPTKRFYVAAICSGHSLIVAGGEDGLCTVEVLNTNTRQWYITSSLTSGITNGTMSICGERLYINCGFYFSTDKTRIVLTCSVPELLQSCQLAEKPQTTPVKQSSIWRRIADTPYYYSSCATLSGRLVAVGGRKLTYGGFVDTTAIFVYDEKTDSWEAMGDMPTARHNTIVAIVSGKMMVVGGALGRYGDTYSDVVEMLS